MEGITTQSQCKVLLSIIFYLLLKLIEKSLLYCKIRVAAIKSLILSYTLRTKLSQKDKTSYQEMNRLGGFTGTTTEPILKDKSHRVKSYKNWTNITHKTWSGALTEKKKIIIFHFSFVQFQYPNYECVRLVQSLYRKMRLIISFFTLRREKRHEK